MQKTQAIEDSGTNASMQGGMGERATEGEGTASLVD